jgi:hypothetical protein
MATRISSRRELQSASCPCPHGLPPWPRTVLRAR